MPNWITVNPRVSSWFGNKWNGFKNAVSTGFSNAGVALKNLGVSFGNSVKRQVGEGAVNIANDVANGLDWFQNNFGSGVTSSTSTSSARGVASGYSPATLPSVNTIPVQSAPITSAVSAISDPEVRANAFNEMMTDSAHQREVKDLIAAGINPVLTGKYGGAGSSAYQVADQVASGSGSGGSSAANTFLGMPLISKPTKPWQIAYNLVAANGDQILNLTQHAAKQFAEKYSVANQLANTVMNNSARR